MKKFILILIAFIGCVCSVKAQALFYIPAGADIESTMVYIYYRSNNQLAVVDYAMSAVVKENLMSDPNFYENKGRGLLNKETNNLYAGMMKFLQNNNGYRYYSKSFRNSGMVISYEDVKYFYYAFSYDWNTMAENPQWEAKYYTRVDKSNFEIKF